MSSSFHSRVQDLEKINSDIFGTPNLQEVASSLSHSETRTTINTTDYDTPLESFDEASDVEDLASDQLYDGTNDISTIQGSSRPEETASVSQNGSSEFKNDTDAHQTARTSSGLSLHSKSQSLGSNIERTRTLTELYELDLARTISQYSQKLHPNDPNHPQTHPDGVLIEDLDWDSPDDPGNPHNWSNLKKWFVTMTSAGICLVVTFGSSLYVSGAFDIQAKLGASQELVLAGLTFYLVGLALGPLIAAPISETFGRKIVYISSLPISMLFIMGVGLAQNIGTILVLRFFSGFFASPAMLIAGGTIADVWSPDMMGLAMSTFCLAPFLGPVIGPVIGGFVAENKGWKWCMWVNLMAAGAILPLVFLADETYKKTILKRRAKKRGIKIRSLLSTAEMVKLLVMVNLARPLTMLVSEPIVMAFSVYVAFVFAVLFGFFELFPVIFRGTYGMGLGISGLPFLGIGIGLFIGTLFFVLVDRLYFFKKNPDGSLGRKGKNGEPFKHTPESRLFICKVAAVSFPVSLFWMGWCARTSVHYMAVVAAGVPFGFSLILIFFAVMLYFTMSYPPLSVASALLANNLLRYILASVFPLFTVQMYDRLGNGWASSIFGFIALLMVPVPWVFEKWGPLFRARSKFGIDAAKAAAKVQDEESRSVVDTPETEKVESLSSSRT